MPSLPFVTLDVFTRDRYAGNPLAVVRLPADEKDGVAALSTEQMILIAREFNLSETIFLYEGQEKGKEKEKEWRVRIFLPWGEIPFAGHPTIGAAVYALSAANVSRGRFIANAGPIELSYTNGVARASIPHNFHEHTQHAFTPEEVYALQPSLRQVMELKQEDIHVVSPVKGMNFITIKLPDLATLSSLTSSPKPAPRLDDEWDVGFAGSYFYVLTPSPSASLNTISIQTRMIEGSLEDPATGSAACALSCLLALPTGQRKTHVEITQGVDMGRRSDIGVVVTLTENLDAVERVELEGSAVGVMEGRLEI